MVEEFLKKGDKLEPFYAILRQRKNGQVYIPIAQNITKVLKIDKKMNESKTKKRECYAEIEMRWVE